MWVNRQSIGRENSILIAMKTAIITDSNSGIFEAEGKALGVFVLPMPVILNNEAYFEGENLSHEQLFRCLYEHKKVSTSQPNIVDVCAMWETVLSEGYDEVVYIPMSSGLSSSCAVAQGLAQEYNGCVQVVDNRRVSVTLRHAVMDALCLRERGLNAMQIREILENTAGDSIIYLGVSTLEYFKLNGRATAASAAIATVLNIKPLLVSRGDKFEACDKIRGKVKCQKKLISNMRAEAERLTANGARIYVGAAGSFADAEAAAEWENMVKEAFPEQDVRYDPLTFSVACHTGPDAFGMGISRVAAE